MLESSDIIVLTSPGACDPSIAIAACRAGARGVLDLEFCADPVAAVRLLFESHAS